MEGDVTYVGLGLSALLVVVAAVISRWRGLGSSATWRSRWHVPRRSC